MRGLWIITAAVFVATGCGSGAHLGGTGQNGPNGPLCDQLQAQYTAAVSASLACTPGAPNQCQALVGIAASACPSTACDGRELVNDDTQVEAARQSWLGACGPSGFLGCPVSQCAPPAPRTCVPTSPGAPTGTCMTVAVPDPPDAAYESCDQLTADYEGALNAALFCTPGAPNQCQQYAVTQFNCGLCPYFVAVNDSTAPRAVADRWSKQCCAAYSMIICNGPGFPPPGVCNPVDAGSPTGGLCIPGQRPSMARDAGAPPDGGESCDQLTADYVQAASAALACTPGAPNQCQAYIYQQPVPCGTCGSMAANDSPAVSTAWQRWHDAGCSSVSCRATATTCAPAAPGICVPSGGGNQSGFCVNRSPDGGT